MGSDIVEEVKAFLVRERLVGGQVDIGESDSLLDDGIIDSLGILELTAFIGKRYDIHVLTDELVPENFESLRAIKSYVEKKLL